MADQGNDLSRLTATAVRLRKGSWADEKRALVMERVLRSAVIGMGRRGPSCRGGGESVPVCDRVRYNGRVDKKKTLSTTRPFGVAALFAYD